MRKLVKQPGAIGNVILEIDYDGDLFIRQKGENYDTIIVCKETLPAFLKKLQELGAL